MLFCEYVTQDYIVHENKIIVIANLLPDWIIVWSK